MRYINHESIVICVAIFCVQLNSRLYADCESPKSNALSLSQTEILKSLYERSANALESINNKTINKKQAYGEIIDMYRKEFESALNGNPVAKSKIVTELIQVEEINFTRLALEIVVENLANDVDRKLLVELLSKKCPDRIYLDLGIEDLLVIIKHKQLTKGFLVLCDAYRASDNPDTKHTICDAIERSLIGLNINIEDSEDGFIDKCEIWYKDNFKVLVINRDYLHHLTQFLFDYKKNGIFRIIE